MSQTRNSNELTSEKDTTNTDPPSKSLTTVASFGDDHISAGAQKEKKEIISGSPVDDDEAARKLTLTSEITSGSIKSLKSITASKSEQKSEQGKASATFTLTEINSQKSLTSDTKSAGGSAPASESSFSKVWLDPRSSQSLYASRPGSLIGTSPFYRSKSASSAGSRKYGTHGSDIRNPLLDMSDNDLVKAVDDLLRKKKNLELENMIFIRFLKKNDPSLIEAMESTIKTAQVVHERASISSRRLTLTRLSKRESSLFAAPSASFTSQHSQHIGLEKEGPKINITQKTDLILKEIDEIKEGLETFAKKCHIARHKLKADLEEMNLREMDIQNMIDTFEDAFIKGNLEKYAQKNPADRFARFMEDSFKKIRTAIDKLRLRTSSMKVQYQKIQNQLIQKKMLGENLQEVDFEQLQIQNRRLVEKIDKRNLLLIELKKMNGHANLLLSKTKKHLLKKLDELKEIQDTIAYREDLTLKLDAESEKVSAELDSTKAEYDRIKTKTENYQVPPVLDYVKTKAELGILKKNLKIWTRRKQVKDMALTASVREMKHTTGQKHPKASWFVKPTYVSSHGEFEFVFEKLERESVKPVKKKRVSKRITRRF